MTTDLTVVDQRQVTFYGDELSAVKATDGQVYVSLPSMCRALGLTIQGQARRINRHEVLSEGYTKLAIMATFDQDESKRRRMSVLRVDLVPLWLSGVDTRRVRPGIQDKLRRFQHEAARVLWEAFQEGQLTADPAFGELLEQDTPEAAAYKMIQGMLQLARNQLLMRAELDDHGRRLEQVEAQLGDPGRAITPEQASQLSQAVKAVAMAMSEKSGRNEYGGVYGELYRKFGITSYKLLPSKRFQEAMDFLTIWHQSLVGEGPF